MTISADLIGFNHHDITSQVVFFSKEKAVIRPSCTNMWLFFVCGRAPTHGCFIG